MMRPLAGLLMIALAAGACSPAETADEGAAAPAAAEKRMPLADCSEVETQDAGPDGWMHPDCRMMFADQSGLALEARYTAAEDDTTKVSIQIVGPGDATLQTIDEIMGNTFEKVSLQDINEDGKPDVRVPLETGNVNTTWAIWLQGESQIFSRAGEVSGVSIVRDANGRIAVPARTSALEWAVAFYTLEGGVLQSLATATVAAAGDPDKVTGVACTVSDDGGLAAAGLSVETIRDELCAEPVVADIFK